MSTLVLVVVLLLLLVVLVCIGAPGYATASRGWPQLADRLWHLSPCLGRSRGPGRGPLVIQPCHTPCHTSCLSRELTCADTPRTHPRAGVTSPRVTDPLGGRPPARVEGGRPLTALIHMAAAS